ncbi:histidine utilization repressor [Sphingomonas psychrotolerans]|uniref:Histidine utilization repressor n=2 Tax=Sphingomonas psychrotolerans TaxID=1327635 RepID=A0A2K8MNK3_9SPHN|nr:histidine utilization repressor [Sphingomonas psychrotolerans]
MSGALRPGDRIPFEHELMAEYGCARMTVNKALSALASAGLIARQRRRGSFVTRPRIHMAALRIPDIREEIEKRGHVYALRLVTRSVLGADSPSAAPLRLSHGKLLSLRCVHLADARPYAVEERLINLAAVPDAMDADFAIDPPGSWLLAHVPWTEAEHRITAAPAGDTAILLELDTDKPCLVLERWTWREAETITYVRTIFDGDSFDLTAHFASQG